ncbi:dsDNA nuclease domain-containing protein [Undibacterium sp. Ji22W]|uniref:dsDNA nuclease domain-containing protein n=1 Tax=Undibacterium sp. Ji22W TaxID=3413038 RepID=UPI003BF40ADA
MNTIVTLGQVTPREQDGRDAFARFRAQVRAAAIASLAILESKEVDRIYCDLHDDYVIRSSFEGGRVSYEFVQVKTKAKQNENWTIGELLGIDGRVKDLSKHSAAQIKDSFVGKLLLHTAIFGEACEKVRFQTNNNLDTKASAFSDGLQSNPFTDEYVKLVLKHFNECYTEKLDAPLSEEDIEKFIRKLFFETDVSHLKLKNIEFDSTVRKKIHEYSEIELSFVELSQILMKLVELVSEKSSGVIDDFNEKNIEKFASVPKQPCQWYRINIK